VRLRLPTLGRQGAWAVVDQVLSSGTNFVPAILLARVLGPSDFGAFSLAYVAWFSVLAIIRSALMTPYTLDASAAEGARWRDITKRAGGAIVLVGVFCGVVFAIVGLVIGTSSEVGQALLVVGILAPGLALQEFWRVAAFAASRARTAAANDAYWAAGQVVAFSALLVFGNATVVTSLFAWGAGAWLAAGLGTVQLSVRPRVDLAAVRWTREWLGVGAYFTATTAIFAAGSLGVAVIIAANIGNVGVGLFRTVQTMFGPVQLLTIGGASVFLPYLVRGIKSGADGTRESQRYSLLMTVFVTIYGVALLVTAHTLLTNVFGPTFDAAAVLVLPMLVAFALDTVASGAGLLLRARALGGRLLVAQLIGTVARIAGVAVLVSVGGLRGAGWGLAIGSGITTAVLWAQVALSSRGDAAFPDATTLTTAHELVPAEAG